MIRNFTLFFILTLHISSLKAQTFGIGTDNPDPNAIMELNSTSLGFLMTRLTTAQRNSNLTGLTGAQEGLLIYNTTDDEFNYWDGAQWIAFPGGLDDDWYEANTTTAPNSINDNVYTRGLVGIGLNNPSQSLHISSTSAAIQSILVEDLASGGNAYNPSLATVARGDRASVIVDKTSGLMYAVDADDIFWRLDGNANINNAGYGGSCPNLITTSMNASAYDFIGTRDNEDFIFATNDRERMRILRDGQMVFYGKGTAVPASSPTGCVPAYPAIDVASFYSTGNNYPLNAYSEDVAAIFGSAADQTGGVVIPGVIQSCGVVGEVADFGAGVFGQAISATNTNSIGVKASEVSLNGWGLYIEGDAGITGTAYGFSDKSLKTNVKSYTKGLDVVMKLYPKTYKIKDEYSGYGLPKNECIGFIAQDVQEVLPNFVKKANLQAPIRKDGIPNAKSNVNDLLTLNYNGLIPILTSAIQEQQKQIEALQEELPDEVVVPVNNHFFGTITLNAAGKAIVSVDDFFADSFRDFSYQLTSIGSPNHAYVSREMVKGKFEISGQPNAKVSWVVYGKN